MVALLVGAVAVGADDDDGRLEGSAILAADDPPNQRFTLGLDRDVERRFRLFGPRDGTTAAVTVASPATGRSDGEVALTAALVYSPEEHPIPDDLRINLKPRTWGDLDGWEKLGVVMSYAGSAAGAAYLLSRAVD